MTTVEFDYNIGEHVLITAIGMVGVIDSMSIDNNGKQYRTVYWNDSQRYNIWLYPWEIELSKK
jgi:hypothetical protein